MLRRISGLRIVVSVPAFAFEEIGKASLARRQFAYSAANGSFGSQLLGLT